ncbi:hypothetical protein EV714DRAFT_222337 [Schizophyllum commune]
MLIRPTGLSFKAREQYIEEAMDVDVQDETAEAGLATVPPGEEGELHSHAGGDWEDIEENFQQLAHGLSRGDPRTRRDRLERQNNMWALQLDTMTDAYLDWQEKGAPEGGHGSAATRSWTLPVLSFDFAGPETFGATDDDNLINTVLARHGFIGCAPERPTLAFSIKLLSAYRQFHRVCPRFSTEAFLRAMTNIHRVAYVRYRATQFRSAYDCFLAMMRMVDDRVNKVMKRGSSWNAANVCAPCLYEVDGETPLSPRILAAMDGNNSLKLIDDTFRKGNAQQDSRSLQSWRWLEVEYVDRFANEVADAQARAKVRSTYTETSSDGVDDSTDDVAWLNEIETKEVNACVNTCVERWKNLGPEARKKMLSLFSVSGIFLCVCRHGHVLVMCDMIRSGELCVWLSLTMTQY